MCIDQLNTALIKLFLIQNFKGPPDESLPGKGPPAEGSGDCPDKEPAEGLATASLAQGPAVEDPAIEDPAAEGPAAKNPAGGLGNIAQSFLKYKL